MEKNPARVAGCYGKADPQIPVGLKRFDAYLKPKTGVLPTPPQTVTDYKEVVSWPMFGNNKYGDCTMAAAAHAIQLWNAATKQSDPVPSQLAVVSEYFKLTGGADSGLVEANVLKTWRTSGLWGNQIVGYAPVNVHDQNLLQLAVYLYGLAYIGIQVPANAETQFKESEPWTLVPGWQSQKIMGGHAVPIVGYDQQYLYVVTWGEIQPMAYDWWRVYGDEAWAVLPQEIKQAAGFDNLSFDQLLADLKNV
jgi:hypothetical protein